MQFNEIFIAFLNEAQFTKEMLGIGATLIRKANYASKGIYYESFTCLSTGLERIGKLCLILDFYIQNNGRLPDFNYMKNNIGHDLKKIYEISLDVINRHNITFHFSTNLDQDIYQRIIKILSDFAKGDRYSNINILSGSVQKNDSMQMWFDEIDKYIFAKKVSARKKDLITQNAKVIKTMLNDYMLVHHVSENGETISDIEEASWRAGMQEAVAPCRQLFVLQIIRYWVELLIELGYKAMQVNKNEDIPYFSEIFALFFNPDSYFRSRKTWR